MRHKIALGYLLLLVAASPTVAIGKARHAVVIVWDAMRPDFVSEQLTPNLYTLAQQGVTFAHHHSVYPSATEVNGTALFTGTYPARSGIIGNHEFRAKIDSAKPIHTENLESVRKGDELSEGHYLHVPTLPEIIQRSGRKTAIAGAKPVILLADRVARGSAGLSANIIAGATLPSNLLQLLTNLHGPFPGEKATERTRNDWTTESMLDPLWSDGVPAFSFLWMNQPDFTQHQTGPGSRESLEAIKNADANLGRVLRALEVRGVLKETDILIASDHGCSTVSSRVDLAAALKQVGVSAIREFKSKPQRGEVLVVSNSGSTFIYVIGHDPEVIQQIASFLQSWPHTGVIFTQKPVPGVFRLEQVHLDSEEAPDIIVSMRWTPDKNTNGVPGMMVSDGGFGPNQGSHVSLSPFDMHNTLIAVGPDFRRGVVSTLASGNVDIAPTILWIMGVKPPVRMDGRVLTEALTVSGPKVKSFEPRCLQATSETAGLVWRQYLKLTEVNGVAYIDEGNGAQIPK